MSEEELNEVAKIHHRLAKFSDEQYQTIVDNLNSENSEVLASLTKQREEELLKLKNKQFEKVKIK